MPLVASPTVSVGGLALFPSSSPWLMALPWGTLAPEVQEVSSADRTSLGIVSVDVDGASLWLGDDARGLPQDRVMRRASNGALESVALGDMILAPGSSGAMGLGVFGLLLLGFPGFLPPPIDRRWVKDNAEFTCSQVTDVETLLHETLVLVS
jgi:hypothetical protein